MICLVDGSNITLRTIPSPVPNLLGTNLAPSAEEARRIRSTLSQKQTYLARLEAETIRGGTTSDWLAQERDEARRFVEEHNALLMPIRRMPLDVMEEIFVRCLPRDKYIVPNPRKAPLLLGQICAVWRKAAFSMSGLWTSLSIQCSHQTHIALMRLWLSRSTGRPLFLYAYIPSANDEYITAFLQVLGSYLHRIQDLRLCMPHRCHGAVVKTLEPGTPLLERLNVQLSPSRTAEMALVEMLSITGDSAPRIRSFSWGSQGIGRNIFAFRSTHLLKVEVECSLSSRDCIEILRQCPKLEMCDFRAMSQRPPILNTFPSRPILMKQLYSMHLKANQPLGSFFDQLTLPALRDLRVVDMGSQGATRIWSQSHFASFFSRSLCSFQCLHFSNTFSHEDDLIHCLQRASASLVEIRVSDYRGLAVVADKLLKLLTYCESSDGLPLCPCLEVIHFGGCISSSDGTLARMVESRWRSGVVADQFSEDTSGGGVHLTRPRYIILRGYRNHSEDVRRLERLRNEGLEFQ